MSAVIESEALVHSPTPHTIASLNDDLNTNQKLFVYYWLQNRNGTKSAKLAGYTGEDNVLAVTACNLLKNPKIKNAIEDYYRSRLLSKDGVLAELSDIAGAPWRDHVEVKIDDEGNTVSAQLKLSDKIRAAELVGKFHGAFIDKVETTNLNIDVEVTSDQVADLIKLAQERRQQQVATSSDSQP